MLVGMQSIALLAVVLASSRAGCGEPAATTEDAPGRAGDAGLDAVPPTTVADAFAADAPPPPPPCADLASCRAVCEGSSWQRADACVRWADTLRARHGSDAKRDRVGARDVYRRTCAQTRDALACTRIALAG